MHWTFQQRPTNQRAHKRGLGIFLLPVVIAVALLSTDLFLPLVLAATAVAFAGWTFLPRYLSSKVVPLALVGSGIFTLLVLRAFILSGYSLAEFNSIPGPLRVAAYPQILLFQAYAMIAAGLWMTWRAIDENGPVARLVLRERPRITGQRGRPRWGLLLPVVVSMWIEMLWRPIWLHTYWWTLGVTIGLAVLVLVFLLPAFAADAALAGLIIFGLYGMAATRWPQHVPLLPPGTIMYGYGFLWVDAQSKALGAGLLGLALTGVGLWLAPRALDDRIRALFRSAGDADLASRVVRLSKTRADAVDSATAQLRRLERDLHDGAQARLVALGMSLRAAERLIPTSRRLPPRWSPRPG